MIKNILEELKSTYPENMNYQFYYIYHMYINLSLVQLSTVEIIKVL